jgi:hypothetical protein
MSFVFSFNVVCFSSNVVWSDLILSGCVSRKPFFYGLLSSSDTLIIQKSFDSSSTILFENRSKSAFGGLKSLLSCCLTMPLFLCVRSGSQAGECHQFTKSKFTMARQAGRLPSIYEKQVYDGTAGRAFSINLRKVHLRWYESVNIYHQTIKWKFTMAR